MPGSKIMDVGLGGIGIRAARRVPLHPEIVEALAESMQEVGLLNPIVLRPKDRSAGYWLVSGNHRFEAARKLKWKSIRATVIDGLDADHAELAELDENLVRLELSPAQRALHVEARKTVFERLHPESRHGGDRKSEKAKSSSQNENLKSFISDTAGKTGKARSTVARDVTRGRKVAVLADIVNTSLDQGDELDALAKLPELEQRKLAKAAKAGEKVSARTRVKQIQRAEREQDLGARQAALPDKKFGVIVADPEWNDETWSEAGKNSRHPSNHYPTSDESVIASRPVKDIAAPDCVLWLWTTNQHLRIALGVMEAWSFEFKSLYIWDKIITGTGRWNRSRNEVLLIGTKGNPPCPAPGLQWDSIITEKREGAHSTKPEAAMRMIESYYPTLSKIELNCRGAPRPGWIGWGLEAPPVDPPAAAPPPCALAPAPRTADDDLGIPAFLRREHKPIEVKRSSK